MVRVFRSISPAKICPFIKDRCLYSLVVSIFAKILGKYPFPELKPMKSLAISLLSTFLVVSACVTGFGQAVAADLVITNANVRTMDARRTVARSLAVLNGKIIAIGTDADTKSLIGKGTRVINAQGRTVLPGFNDAHVHFLPTGSQLSSVDLRTAKSPEEFVRRIK